MRNLSIGAKLAISFGVIVLIFGAVAAIQYRSNRIVSERLAEYIHWNEVALGLSEEVSRTTIQLVNAIMVYRANPTDENRALADEFVQLARAGITDWYAGMTPREAQLMYDAVSGASRSFIGRNAEETLSRLDVLVAAVDGDLTSVGDGATAAATARYVDGLYHAEYSHTDSHAWRAFVNITVSGGRIVSAVYDYVDPAGGLKSLNEGYASTMDRLHGLTPQDYMSTINSKFVASQAAGIDGVSGATGSQQNANELAEALLARALVGDTRSVVLPMDDTYSATEEAPGPDGLIAEVSITFENDEITAVGFAAEDAEGQVHEIANPATVERLTTALLESGDPESIGAGALRDRFVALADAALATRQETPPPPSTDVVPDWM